MVIRLVTTARTRVFHKTPGGKKLRDATSEDPSVSITGCLETNDSFREKYSILPDLDILVKPFNSCSPVVVQCA